MKRTYSAAAPTVICGLMVTALLGSSGCGREPASSSTQGTAAQPTEKRYPLTGEVVRIDPARRTAIVTHDKIEGFMPAMTMEFIVEAGDLAILKPGQRIRAELVEGPNNEWRLEKIWPDDQATKILLDASARALAQDTSMRGKGAYREIGETAPDFTLLDQEGRAVSMRRFRGKQVVVNFIFTRCPIATMCPAATERMVALQQAAKAAGIADLELISISLDPEFDTPGVLKHYATVRGIDTANFTFLTGPDAAVRQLLAQLGVIREFADNTIKHSLATLLINPQGKIIHRAEGSVWRVEQFTERMEKN